MNTCIADLTLRISFAVIFPISPLVLFCPKVDLNLASDICFCVYNFFFFVESEASLTVWFFLRLIQLG